MNMQHTLPPLLTAPALLVCSGCGKHGSQAANGLCATVSVYTAAVTESNIVPAQAKLGVVCAQTATNLQEVACQNARLAPWTYIIPDRKANPMRTPRASLVELKRTQP